MIATMNDPFGIYRDETLRPTSPVAGGQVASGQAGDGGGAGWLIVGILLGVALLVGWQRFGGDGDGGKRDRDQQEQRDDRKEDREQQAKVEGKTLVFVHERDPQSIEHDLLLRQMDGYVKQRGLDGYRALDDDLQDEQTRAAIAFAKSKGIDSPFVLLTDKQNRPASVIKWPAGTDGLDELFK